METVLICGGLWGFSWVCYGIVLGINKLKK